MSWICLLASFLDFPLLIRSSTFFSSVIAYPEKQQCHYRLLAPGCVKRLP